MVLKENPARHEGARRMRQFSRRGISFFGLGRVGLVTAVCFAKKGYKVYGIDPDRSKLDKIARAEPPFFEPKLTEYLEEVIGNGKFLVTDDPSVNANSDIAYIAVGTPSNDVGGIDLAYVKNAASAIGRSLRDCEHFQIVVIRSTATPGTARKIVKPIIQNQSGKSAGRDFGLCSNPEFLREGSALYDTEFPDRIIIGSDHQQAMNGLDGFYKEIYGDHMPPVVLTTHENAELIKYANNAFLAMKVSFINTIACIAEGVPGADVLSIAAGIGLDGRIGPRFLNAGIGWGGSCFPKDLKALLSFSKSLGYDAHLIEAVVRTNEQQKERAVGLLRRALGSLKEKKIAVLGLAFKPGTDDMREAVSIPIINTCLSEGAKIATYDPAAMQNARNILSHNITYATEPLECLNQADCCIIVTEWDEFKRIPPSAFVERMRRPLLIDGRRIYDATKFTRAGVEFLAVGLGPGTYDA